MGDGWLVDFKKRIGLLSKPDLYVMVKSNRLIIINIFCSDMSLILVHLLKMHRSVLPVYPMMRRL